MEQQSGHEQSRIGRAAADYSEAVALAWRTRQIAIAEAWETYRARAADAEREFDLSVNMAGDDYGRAVAPDLEHPATADTERTM